jgi:hypothetical protein
VAQLLITENTEPGHSDPCPPVTRGKYRSRLFFHGTLISELPFKEIFAESDFSREKKESDS